MSSNSSSHAKYLLTGVTGGLGSKILDDLLSIQSVDPSDIIATSRSASKAAQFTSRGLQFRVADYKDPSTLRSAFQGVKELLFVSSSESDSEVRQREHKNVIDAAVASSVGRVWYVSLAFGGWSDTSRVGFQQAHYDTENLLRESGLNFVSLRAGVYADAFPLFLNWYPESREVTFPRITPSVDGSKIAFATRDELGEGIAKLLATGLGKIQPKTDKNIVLLTTTQTNSLPDLVGAISRGQKTELPIRYLEPQEWITESAKDDIGGKPLAWFEARLVFAQGVAGGDAEETDPALSTLLGREPETGVQAAERMVREAGAKGYRWHQNHASGK